MKKIIFYILIVLLFLSAGGFGIYFIIDSRRHETFSKEYDEYASEYVKSNFSDDNLYRAPDVSAMPDNLSPFKPPVCIDFSDLLRKSSSVIGWIYCDDTQINYPVVIGSDNTFYLSHGITGDYNGYGAIFADCGNDGTFSEPNTIPYGHHMTDGSMFADVAKYKKQEYYNEHPVLWLFTPESTYMIDVYSCYVTGADSDAYKIKFNDFDEYAAWLKKTMDSSLIKSEVSPDITSRILTLSTCSYEFSNARCVLHGLLVYA